MMQEVKFCPACGNTKFENFYSCKDYTVSNETFQIIKCPTCSLAATSPRPSEEILGNYYLSKNYISHSNKANSFIDRLYLIVRKFTLKQKLNLISKYSSTSTILDYGCGTGEFINICKSNSWNIIGIEPSNAAREKAAMITHSKVYSSLADLPNIEVNVITLWHVLEHVPDFNNVLKKLSTHLTKNGIIFIAVPNYESYDAESYQELWAGYDVPRHLWHFSKFSLEKILNNNSLTLKSIVPMKFDSFYVSLLSEKYKHNNTFSIKGFLNAISIGLKSNWKARRTGNYSSLIYIIQK